MAEFSFGFTVGSLLQLNGQKLLRSVAEDLIKKELNEFIKNGEGTDIININSQANISQQIITLSNFYSACENKYHVMKTSSV